MSSVIIQSEIYQLMDDIANIKNQLDFADEDILEGLDVDKDWYHNAKHALRKKNIALLKLNHDLAKANKEEKLQAHRNYLLCSAFVGEAKKTLPSEQYKQLMDFAKSKFPGGEL